MQTSKPCNGLSNLAAKQNLLTAVWVMPEDAPTIVPNLRETNFYFTFFNNFSSLSFISAYGL